MAARTLRMVRESNTPQWPQRSTPNARRTPAHDTPAQDGCCPSLFAACAVFTTRTAAFPTLCISYFGWKRKTKQTSTYPLAAGEDEIERKYTPTTSDDEVGYVDLDIKVRSRAVRCCCQCLGHSGCALRSGSDRIDSLEITSVSQ